MLILFANNEPIDILQEDQRDVSKTAQLNKMGCFKSTFAKEYAIISQDIDNSLPLRKVHRAAHLERLKELNQQGRLLIAGPHPAEDTQEPSDAGFTGSLVVLDFESLQEAQSWADIDPYFVNGVYQSVTVKPFMKVLP